MAALYGNLHIRAFADVDRKARLEGVKALLAVRDEFRDVVALQVVAFAQDGIVREPGADRLMQEAMEMGADVVGGIPWIEPSEDAAAEHIRVCFDLAETFGKDVSMLLDDVGDPAMRTLEMMAKEAIRRGWQGRALAHHCRAMALYPPAVFEPLVELLRRAQVSVVSDPHTGPLHARVKELLARRHQCLPRPGRHLRRLLPVRPQQHARGRVPRGPPAGDDGARRDRDALRHGDHGAGPSHEHREISGSRSAAPAHLVVRAEADVVEALQFHASPRHVISHGRRVDLSRMRELAGIPD